jgi:hypothetical protein
MASSIFHCLVQFPCFQWFIHSAVAWMWYPMCVYTAEHAPCEHVECKSRHHGVGCVSVKLYRHIFLHMSNSVFCKCTSLVLSKQWGRGGTQALFSRVLL